MKICIVGDVVAAPGRRILKDSLPSLLTREKIDLCIVNGENAAHGVGISNRIADEMFSSGADVITLGNHAFSNYDFISFASRYDNIAVPANSGGDWPGSKYVIYEKNGIKYGIMNLLGQFGMNPVPDNPFYKADEIIKVFDDNDVRIKILDFHAEATSEKTAIGYYLDGRASIVAGTHTHVQTSDNRILKNGTGYITDIGMTGCIDSVIGMDIETSVKRLKDKLPERYKPAEGDAFMCGIIADVDKEGVCLDIRRFCEYE